MPQYMWEGIDHSGTVKRGQAEAPGPENLQEVLLEEGIALLSFKKLQSKNIGSLFPKKIGLNHMCLFFENLSMMIESGVDLLTSIKTLVMLPSLAPMHDAISSLISDVEHGASLSTALSKQQNVFSPFVIHLIRAGEKASKLPAMLNKLAEHLQRDYALQKKIRSALFAPLVTLILALVIIAGIVLFILPQFQTLYDSAGQTLPASTQALLHISSSLKSWHFFSIIAGSFLLFLLTKKYIAGPIKNYYRNAVLTYGPENSLVALFERISLLQTLALFLSSGLQLTDALEQARSITQSTLIRQKITLVINALHEGLSVRKAFALAGPPLIDNQLLALIQVGEQAGNLDIIFAKAAYMCEEKLNTSIHRMTTILPSLIMILVGLIIGFLMVAIYKPIFTMGNLFKM